MSADIAEQSLRNAASPDQETRHGQFARFMQEVEALLEHPADHAEFVARTALLIPVASEALRRWARSYVKGIYEGGEDAALESLHRRTQLELARELYRDTVAAPLFEDIASDEGDDDLRERANDLALDAPPYVPSSHRWWRW